MQMFDYILSDDTVFQFRIDRVAQIEKWLFDTRMTHTKVKFSDSKYISFISTFGNSQALFVNRFQIQHGSYGRAQLVPTDKSGLTSFISIALEDLKQHADLFLSCIDLLSVP